MLPANPFNLSLSAGGGGPSGVNSDNGFGTPISTPFNFDHSGWVVNFGDGNSTTATGNRDANQTSQTPSGGMSIGSLLGGLDPKWLLLAGAAYLLLRNR